MFDLIEQQQEGGIQLPVEQVDMLMMMVVMVGMLGMLMLLMMMVGGKQYDDADGGVYSGFEKMNTGMP